MALLEWVLRLGPKSKKAKTEAGAGAAAVGCPGWHVVGRHLNAFDGS